MKDKEKTRQTDREEGAKGPSRRISLQVPLDVLRRDLEDFRQKALDFGSSMAAVIPADWAEVDERVRLKCSVPMCRYYGKNPYCPPQGPDLDFMRRALGRYHWAVLYALDVLPVSEFAERDVQREAGAKWARKTMEIAGKLETLAFGNGYYLAVAFAQGNCMAALCTAGDECRVLQGKRCVQALKARPSMEAVGIDVFALVSKAGWDVYPIYRSVEPGMVLRALSVGIVFVY
jgi:predicted metal-binding protein